MSEKLFYKAVEVEGSHSSYRSTETAFIFKNVENGKISWLSAYSDRNGTNFIVESGAGIPEKKMERQIMTYLKRRLKTKGYL